MLSAKHFILALAFALIMQNGSMILPSLANEASGQPFSQRLVIKKKRIKKDNPQLRAALHALYHAKDELQAKPDNFNGHRAQALQLTDQAIEQCKTAIQLDCKQIVPTVMR